MIPAAARYFHPSNLLTYVSVLAGLCAIFAAHGLQSWPTAGGLIAVCALADTFDGRFARIFTRGDSLKDFGMQLDSLADALTFGVVPVICLFVLLSFESAAAYVFWCAAAFFYVVSAITRLGAFNLHHAESGGFVGLPTTVAGLIWSSAFLAQLSVITSAVLLIACGILMVSSIRIPRPAGLGMVAFVAWPVLLIGMHVAGSR
jgi:CDP-diacylglycerol---serine O-phosphatidyltransferase